jgi:phosphatidylglycerophosphatase A
MDFITALLLIWFINSLYNTYRTEKLKEDIIRELQKNTEWNIRTIEKLEQVKMIIRRLN